MVDAGMFTEYSSRWVQKTEYRVTKLDQALAAAVNHTGFSSSPGVAIPPQQREASIEQSSVSSGCSVAQDGMPDMMIVVDLETSPGALPGHYLLSTASSGRSKCRHRDNITRGVIRVEDAEKHLTAYQNLLGHILYSILANNHRARTSIVSLRGVSTGLMTAICKVGALYLASPDFDILYREFVAISAGLSSTKRSTLNDVLALCIGAFWLEELPSS